MRKRREAMSEIMNGGTRSRQHKGRMSKKMGNKPETTNSKKEAEGKRKVGQRKRTEGQ